MEAAAAQDSRPSDNGGIDGGSIDYTTIRQEVLLVIEKAITGHDLNNVEVDFLTDAPKDLVLDILDHGQEVGGIQIADRMNPLTPSALAKILDIVDPTPTPRRAESSSYSPIHESTFKNHRVWLSLSCNFKR